jgi:hypothetical protein
METKIRNIGNALGIILLKDITKSLNLNVDKAIELNVEDERLVISRKKQSFIINYHSRTVIVCVITHYDKEKSKSYFLFLFLLIRLPALRKKA